MQRNVVKYRNMQYISINGKVRKIKLFNSDLFIIIQTCSLYSYILDALKKNMQMHKIIIFIL